MSSSGIGYRDTSVKSPSTNIRMEKDINSPPIKYMKEEPLLNPIENRFVLFPIKYPQFWDHYKKQLACFWTAEEIKLQQDRADWETLTKDEQHFIKNVLAFFAGSDGIVFENLDMRFLQEIQVPELKSLLSFQGTMEQIHSETYSLLIDTYIRDTKEKHHLFNAIDTIPCVAKKANWALKWINDESSSFAKRLLAFACVEGIFFSGSFCAIYWIKQRGLLPGLTFSNELISRDEGMHVETAVLIYNELVNKLSQEEIHKLVSEAVHIETEFIVESIPCALIGMNAGLMTQYIQFVADRLLVQFGYERLFNSENPFDFMEMISLQGKTNFFEKRVSDYSKAKVSNNINGGVDDNDFDDDF